MRRLLTLAATALLATLLLPTGLATAAPAGTGPLPDASLLCGTTYETEVEFALTPAISDAIWITSGDYAGKYTYVQFSHWLTPGLQYDPVLDPEGAGFTFAGGMTFGKKTGQSTLSCEIVSRWDFEGTADDFTVYAPAILARASA